MEFADSMRESPPIEVLLMRDAAAWPPCAWDACDPPANELQTEPAALPITDPCTPDPRKEH